MRERPAWREPGADGATSLVRRRDGTRPARDYTRGAMSQPSPRPGDPVAPGPSDPVPVDLRDYVDFDLDEASGRRVFTTDVLAVDLLCLEPGQVDGVRSFATADVVYTVLGGIAWVTTDEAEVTLQALQALLVPAGVVHGLRNDAADPLIVQRITSPPDEAPPSAPGPAPGQEQRQPAPPVPSRPPLAQRLRRRR